MSFLLPRRKSKTTMSITIDSYGRTIINLNKWLARPGGGGGAPGGPEGGGRGGGLMAPKGGGLPIAFEITSH